MEFKRILEPTDVLRKNFINFCVKSKPFHFCEIPSLRLKLFKINEYFDFLFAESLIFIGEENQEFKFFIALSLDGPAAQVDFYFGGCFAARKTLEDFRSWYLTQNQEVEYFWAALTRSYKYDKYIRAIKRIDPKVIFKLDKQKMCIYWYS